MFRLESLTGLFVGLVMAALTLPAAWLAMGSLPLAITLSLSLVAACAVATLVAVSLPWLMSRGDGTPRTGAARWPPLFRTCCPW